MGIKFLSNDNKHRFLDEIKNNLQICSEFYFSVSFIVNSGLSLISEDIEKALQRGAKGRLITSTYQNFTDIESLRKFSYFEETYKKFKFHLDDKCFRDDQYVVTGYHTKGYLFIFDDDSFNLVIGSSNLTRYALLKNFEWDLSVKDQINSKLYKDVKDEFDYLWNGTFEVNDNIIKTYKDRLYYSVSGWGLEETSEYKKASPNSMQRKALKELTRYRSLGTNRALVVSAAGSGKTYLAAFDSMNYGARKLLYIVHEGSILEKSLETFENVFGPNRTYGIYNGKNADLSADFIFASNIMMAKNIDLFDSNEFDYIVVDECHRAVAETYKKIINKFKPGFLLGITATPERMDQEDVFELFDNNVPYELRLRDAIKNKIVVPFEYYGVRDNFVNYGLDDNDDREFISELSSENNCLYISEQIEKHRKKDEKLKALVFCKNLKHASRMCNALAYKYKGAFLSGQTSIADRIKAYEDLQDEEKDLEMLFTVDILNEGVDIPGVNMVLFLRPTESSTVFIQQLGRGLRKYKNKKNVKILDFIGNNYKRSTQIAVALGTLSERFILEKTLLKSLIKDDFSQLGLKDYGVNIYFDDLSKEEIIRHIDEENFNTKKYLESDYNNFKKYISNGSYPKHMDYLNNDFAPNILNFINASTSFNGKSNKNKSYYTFLTKMGEDLPEFDDEQIKYLEYLSSLLPIVRISDFAIAKEIIAGNNNLDNIKYKYEISDEEFNHAIKFLEKDCALYKQENNYIQLNVKITDEYLDFVNDLLDYGLNRYESDFKDIDKFKLYANYSYEQFQRIMLKKNPKYNQKGTYVYDDEVYMFASLKKKATLNEHLKYKDKFIDAKNFQWECEKGLNDENQKALIHSKKSYLFVRKEDNEDGIKLPYTFVGTGDLVLKERLNDSDKVNRTLLFNMLLDTPLPGDLQYDFVDYFNNLGN